MTDDWSSAWHALHRIATGVLVACLVGAHGMAESAHAVATNLPEFHHTAWTPKDGAPAQISALAQTADGWLWLGTTTGLYRFDGMAFERIEAIDGVVRTVFALPRGGLLIGYARGGASLLEGDKLIHYGQAQGLPSVTVHEFAHDRKGRLWAAAQNGLFRFDGVRWNAVELETGPAPGYVTSVVVDGAGTVWVRAAEQIFALPEDAKTFRRVTRLRSSESWIYLAVSPDGSAWASGSESGLLRLSLDGPPSDPRAATNGGTGPLHFDHEGRAWVVRAGGLELAAPSALPDLSGPSRQVFTPAQGLSGEIGYAVVEDREGNVWFGSEGGLDRFRRSTLHTMRFAGSGYAAMAPGNDGELLAGGARMGRVIDGAYHELPKAPGSVLMCAHRGRGGAVWMGGKGELWRIAQGRAERVPLPEDVVANDFVQAMVEDTMGGLWISVRGGANHVSRLAAGSWSRWEGPPELGTFAPNVMAGDADGRLWFGYANDRIAVIDGTATRVLSAADGLEIGDVLAIHMRGRRTWIGGSRGVALFENGRFRPLRGSGNLPIRGVSGIVETAAGDLWMNGSDGITHITKRELDRFIADPDQEPRFERLDPRDGLEGVAPQVRPLPTAVEGFDGKLWFSTSRSLYWLDPERIELNRMEPPIFFRTVRVGGNTFNTMDGMNLPQHTDAVAISYTALSLSRPERVRFRVRLEGVDTDWRDVGAHRQAFYTQLGPGRYRFHVTAANDDGVWNRTGASLAFTIEPAFYQAGWFRCVFAIMALALFYLVYQWQVRRANGHMLDKLQVRMAERERIARELHDTLLQSVSGLILRFHSATQKIPEQEPVRQALEGALELADEVLAEGRDRLLDLRSAVGPEKGLREALREVGRQLGRDQRSRFHVVQQSAPRDLHDHVRDEVYLIAREALLNAFRHAQAGRIEVRLTFAQHELRVGVRDDGRGIDPGILEAGRPGHWGLPGMRERARRIGGWLDIRSDSRRGTKLELRVPAKWAYRDGPAGWWARWRWRILAIRLPSGQGTPGVS
ncbi:MAG TPA: ATP-binding protein [Albitalea sp.]|uniref:sensor histidine kinase n=1 Tax=Piscinibacter sp. TaxID=1903157 RepID=UPI002ED1E8C5